MSATRIILASPPRGAEDPPANTPHGTFPAGSGGDTLPRLVAIDSFRGLAILLIVAGHLIEVAGLHVDTFQEKVLVNLVKGGTSFFVFISGFLFHYLLPQKFQYWRFLRQKAEYVLLPYLVMSAFFMTYDVAARQQPIPSYGEPVFPYGIDQCCRFASSVIQQLWTGKHLDGYWYVPFIMAIFLVSPAFLRYTKLRVATRLAIMGAAILVAMFVHRPVKNLSVLQSGVYFLPVYLLGINVSMDRERVLRRLAGKEWLLGIVLLGLSVTQVAWYRQYGSMHKPALEWGGADFNLLQKMLACLFLYSLFSRIERLNQPVLKTLAASSFAIYFLHPVVIKFLSTCGGREWLLSAYGPLPGIVLWILWTLVVTTLSYGIAITIRWLVPGVSRRIIGW